MHNDQNHDDVRTRIQGIGKMASGLAQTCGCSKETAKVIEVGAQGVIYGTALVIQYSPQVVSWLTNQLKKG